MHVVVIGAGVVGVTTAYALQQRGHRVTVLERLEAAGLETSFGNAGQRSYGVVYPWADADMVRYALPWLIKQDGPLKMHWPPSLAAMRFLLATLKYAYAPGAYGLNKRAMLRLGTHSKACFERLDKELGLKFDGDTAGLIQLASTPAELRAYQQLSGLLKEMGVAHSLLTPAQVREYEPGMTGGGPLYGGIRFDTDATGDCHLFTRALTRACEQAGVVFRYHCEVTGLDGNSQRLDAVRFTNAHGQTERLEADAFVLSAGCWSAELASALGLRLPIYPVKGYSLTVPLQDPELAPRSTVHDDYYKVVSTRLGNRLRATGFVELADFRRDIPKARLATIAKSVAARFPGCADLTQASAWTGFRPMTPDGPAILGRGLQENLYLNTGHGTFGWTLSAGSADLIAQVIDGEEPALPLDAFRPSRFQE
ncbi:D-amino acid dehydrogenase [Marinobacter sp. X15-166B]|uniref:D-amino acid dehydrogenase n=1 Tax=Marinobacter sp. X15-166B TaxID=1897620 RepID=UPI00085C6AC9|nr:D-amino acid dehydrogenase [Marinobacter sp. X15-166B]OEY65797.1 FAD-dependent oxidoreductase [Marinobacter sp. X15-166B]